MTSLKTLKQTENNQVLDIISGVSPAESVCPSEGTWLLRISSVIKRYEEALQSAWAFLQAWGPKIAAAGALLLFFILFPTKQYFETVLLWVESLGPITGALVFIAIYTVTTSLLVPGVILTIFAGYYYGIVWGSVVSWAGSITGAILSYWVGRSLLHSSVMSWVSKYPILQAVNNILERKDGFKLILLLRLSPITPYGVLNYMLSTTKIQFWPYTLSTAIGVMPGTVMYNWLGTSTKGIADIFSGSVDADASQQQVRGWIFCLSMILSVFVVILVGVVSARALKRELSLTKKPKEITEEELYEGNKSDTTKENAKLVV
mmetsp:Transcript_24669/g.27457  ORF Transcript_24669/g.27457 Transcript_24669/m.27457 type:complete len:318 (+) Transcript_24669:131-1084(+)